MHFSKKIKVTFSLLFFFLLTSVLSFIQTSSAEFDLFKKSGLTGREINNSQTPTDNIKSRVLSNDIAGSDILGRGAGGFTSGSPFQTGFNPDDPESWSVWNNTAVKYDQVPVFPDRYAGPLKSRGISNGIIQSAEQYAVKSGEPVEQVNRKLDLLLGDLQTVAEDAGSTADLYPKSFAEQFMDQADAMAGAAAVYYPALDDMFAGVERMYAALDENYRILNGHETITAELALQFNAASDAMADHAFTMADAVDVMIRETGESLSALTGMLAVFEGAGAGAKGTLGNYDQTVKQVKELVSGLDRSARNLDKTLENQARQIQSVKDYADGINGYLSQLKDYSTEQITDAGEVGKYLADIKAYLDKVLSDLLKAKDDLKKAEDYFRRAKVDVDRFQVGGTAAGVCESAEPVGMSGLRDCAKSCRTVCRWKKKVGDTDCYECPSPSGESCYDIGAWPQDHPWCQPGGVCYDDPMFYCTPYGAVGPNGSPLQCTACKQRPDMCWQHVGSGTTLTNCTLGCWNGTCEYIGRYDQPEWDGRAEWIHCYECVTPPPPPSCEDLGWGYDFKDDCEDKCPAPGTCEKETKKAGGKDKKEDDGDDDGDDNGGQDDDGGDTGSDDDDGTDTGGGRPANPPGGTPEQPGGGPSEIAGGPAPEGTPQETGDKETPAPPADRPGGAAPTPPAGPTGEQPKPSDTDKPNPPAAPEPITNANIQWLEKRLADVDERIKKMEDHLADPKTGDTTRESVARYLEEYKAQRQNILDQIEEEKQKVLKEREEEAKREKARQEYAEQMAERYRQSQARDQAILDNIRKKELEEFRQANENLETRAREMKESLEARRARIQDYDRRIEALEHQMEGGTRTKALEDELAELRRIRNEFARKYAETERAYVAELEELKTEYRKQLFDIDEGARRRAEVERLDEYYERNEELRRLEKTRAVSDAAFESMTRDMEQKIEDAVRAGDEDKAGKLNTELENMKRGKAEWDAVYDTRERRLKSELHEMGWRNFSEGAGPSSADDLVSQFGEYADIFTKQIEKVESALAKIEADGEIDSAQVSQIRSQLDQLRETRDALQAKKESLQQDYRLTQEDVESIAGSTAAVVEGSRNKGEDASFARLFVESLGEEYVHNLNPLVMAKKSAAFAWGVAQGVGSAIKGLVELGIAVNDLMYESYAQALGFEDGGIFGTDATDKLYGMLSTASNYASLDGIVKAAVAAGGIIDGELKKLEKSSDIDWATSELGGKVAGELVVGDAVIEAGLGRLGSALAKTDELMDAGRAADRASDAGRSASRLDPSVPTRTPDIDVPARTTPDAGTAPTRTPDSGGTAARSTPDANTSAPRAPDTSGASSRGPPRSAGTLDNTKPLPRNDRPVTRLDDADAARLETEHGFKEEHAQRMSEFAQQTDTYLIVRDGNVDSVRYFDDVDKVPKPMSSKAKTAKVGPDIGLVVDPTHPKQAKYWAEELTRAAQEGIDNGGDFTRLRELEKARKKALDSWSDYGDYMKSHGYVVDEKTGRVLMETVGPDGEKVFKAVHGDYDLHGAYKRNPDGTVDRASFGDGNSTADGSVLRNQLNDAITGGDKDFIQHGAQDDWIPDPKMVPNKPPDPPVTVFLPDGGTVSLKTAEDMKNFYENTMGIKWDYPAPKTSAGSASKAADTGSSVSKAAPDASGTSSVPSSASRTPPRTVDNAGSTIPPSAKKDTGTFIDNSRQASDGGLKKDLNNPSVPPSSASRSASAQSAAGKLDKPGDFSVDLTTPEGKKEIEALNKEAFDQAMNQRKSDVPPIHHPGDISTRPGFKDVPKADKSELVVDLESYMTPQEKAAKAAGGSGTPASSKMPDQDHVGTIIDGNDGPANPFGRQGPGETQVLPEPTVGAKKEGPTIQPPKDGSGLELQPFVERRPIKEVSNPPKPVDPDMMRDPNARSYQRDADLANKRLIDWNRNPQRIQEYDSQVKEMLRIGAEGGSADARRILEQKPAYGYQPNMDGVDGAFYKPKGETRVNPYTGKGTELKDPLESAAVLVHESVHGRGTAGQIGKRELGGAGQGSGYNEYRAFFAEGEFYMRAYQKDPKLLDGLSKPAKEYAEGFIKAAEEGGGDAAKKFVNEYIESSGYERYYKDPIEYTKGTSPHRGGSVGRIQEKLIDPNVSPADLVPDGTVLENKFPGQKITKP